MQEITKSKNGVSEELQNAPKDGHFKSTMPHRVSTKYKSGYETRNVGNKIILNLGEVNSHKYKRVRDNITEHEIKEDKERYRIIDKLNIGGKRYQLNGTLTEIVGNVDKKQVKPEENIL